MWIVAAVAAAMLVSRIGFVQSPQWLLEHGRNAEAQNAVKSLFGSEDRKSVV